MMPISTLSMLNSCLRAPQSGDEGEGGEVKEPVFGGPAGLVD